MTATSEVVIVAFHIETRSDHPGLTRDHVMRNIAATLPELNRLVGRRIHGDMGPLVEVSSWQAEDDREDGSDNDSAIFVPMGEQVECLEELYSFLEWEGDAAEGAS